MEAYEWCNFTWDEDISGSGRACCSAITTEAKICVWINPYIGQKSPLFEEGIGWDT